MTRGLPQELKSSLGPPEPNDPYKKLCVAVLLRAIQDFFILRSKLEMPRQLRKADPHRNGLELYGQIERYFYDRTLDREPFSFWRMCEILSEEPEQTRRKILSFLQNSEFKSLYHSKRGRCGFLTLVASFLRPEIGDCVNVSSSYNDQ